MSREGLPHLKSLKTLDLNFEGLEEITDEGLKFLCSEEIQLETLSLDFNRCSQITNKGLLALGIQHLKSLRVLNLKFEGLEEITDEGLDIFYEKASCQLKYPITFSINFDKWSQITDEGFKGFCYKILQQFSDLYPEEQTPRSCKFSPLTMNPPIEPVAEIDIKCFDKLWFSDADNALCKISDFLPENEPDEPFPFSFEDPGQITDDDLGNLISDEEDLRMLSKLIPLSTKKEFLRYGAHRVGVQASENHSEKIFFIAKIKFP